MRKIISVLLAVMMIVSMITVSTIGTGAAEVAAPAVTTTVVVAPNAPATEELADKTGYTAISALYQITDLNGKYYLEKDITGNTNTVLDTFTGELHGNGKKITTTVPLFVDLQGTVSNLTVSGTIVTAAAEDIALLAQTASGATVDTVITEGSVTGNSTTDGEYSTAALIATVTGVTTLTNCYNKANVTGKNPNTSYGCAGLIGTANADVTLNDCVNAGAIDGANDAAGILGYASCFVTAKDCYNNGTVIAQADAAGGIIAHVLGDADNRDLYGFDIENCHNMKAVTGGTLGAGIVSNMTANARSRKIVNCTNSGAIEGQTYVGGISGYFNTASGDKLISGCENTGTVRLTNSAASSANGAGGISSYAATGTVIEDCINTGDVYTAARQAGGILGWSAGSITISNCINTAAIDSDAGIAAGIMANSTGSVGNAYVRKFIDCKNYGDITATDYIAGITGYINHSATVLYRGCENYGDVTVSNQNKGTGGIAGYIRLPNTDLDFYDCSNYGSISGGDFTGGILGKIDGHADGNTNEATTKSTKIEFDGLYNKGIVSGKSNVAGIVARIDYLRSANKIEVVFNNCENAGTVNASTSYAAGIIGRFVNNRMKDNSSIAFVGCVNSGSVIGATSGASGIASEIAALGGPEELVANNTTTSFLYCYNTGLVQGGSSYAAGIAASTTGSSGRNEVPYFQYCGNIGTVKNTNASGNASGIVGYNNCAKVYVDHNFFAGTLDATNEYAIGIFGQPKEAASFAENYVIDTCAYKTYIENKATADSTYNEFDVDDLAEGYKFTAAEMANGALAHKLQAATGETDVIWGQFIGLDPNPVLYGAEVKAATGFNGYYSDLVSANLELAQDLTLNAYIGISVLEGDAPEISYSFNMRDDDVAAEASKVDALYKGAFDAIAPQYIGEDIVITANIGDNDVITTTTSVVDYLEALDAEYADIAKALVRYGYEARAYTLAKGYESDVAEVSSTLLDTAALAKPTGVPAMSLDATGYDGEFAIVAAGINFDNVNRLYVKVNVTDADYANASVTIDGKNAELVKIAENTYIAYSEGISAANFGVQNEVVLYDGGEVAATLTYGIYNYADRMANNAVGGALALATYHYGVAAAALK